MRDGGTICFRGARRCEPGFDCLCADIKHALGQIGDCLHVTGCNISSEVDRFSRSIDVPIDGLRHLTCAGRLGTVEAVANKSTTSSFADSDYILRHLLVQAERLELLLRLPLELLHGRGAGHGCGGHRGTGDATVIVAVGDGLGQLGLLLGIRDTILHLVHKLVAVDVVLIILFEIVGGCRGLGGG